MATGCFTGLFYFLAVFTFAFAMGIARQLVIAPRLGPSAAVLIEVPILVLASWIVARRLLRYRSLTVLERAVMGATGFTLTIASEAVLSEIMRGQSVADWAATVATPLGLVGLAAQLIFAAIPIFVNLGQQETVKTV
jgi:hypothetical protein